MSSEKRPRRPKLTPKLRREARAIVGRARRGETDLKLLRRWKGKPESGPTRPRGKPAQPATLHVVPELYDVMAVLNHATCLIRTAKNSLELAQGDAPWDEIKTLVTALGMLRRVHIACNELADGQPCSIKSEEIDNEDHAEGGDQP